MVSVGKENWLASLRERRKVERFTPDSIPEDTLEQILEAGRRSPSPWNLQPWQFIVVTSDAGRARVLEHCHEPGAAATAPVLLVGVADPKAWKRAPDRLAELMQSGSLLPSEEVRQLERIRQQWGTGDTSRVLAIAQTCAALQQIRLVALAFDVCSWWMHDFNTLELGKSLHVPDSLVAVGVLGLGFCESKGAVTPAPGRGSVFGEAYGLPWRENGSK